MLLCLSGQHAVDAVNAALDADDHAATLRALHNPALQLPAVIEHSADRFYHRELRSVRLEKQVCTSVCLSLCLYLCLSVFPSVCDCVTCTRLVN